VALHDKEHVQCDSRAEWRAWLSNNSASSTGVWLVTWKKSSGKPHVTYDDAVLEAIAFGWVDSRPGTVDDERTKGYYSPRKPTSGWSRVNKKRVDTLRTEGLMTPQGEAVIAAAMANGAWESLDDVENLVEPEELRTALDTIPRARENWDGFPRGAKRGILEWISLAKQAETRARRISETAEAAARGERANQWKRPASDAHGADGP